MKCFAEPRKDGLAKQPRCADGETYIPAAWTSCQNKGSARIQCPQNHYPCSTLTGSAELPEFRCSTTCADTVRAQQCQGISRILSEWLFICMCRGALCCWATGWWQAAVCWWGHRLQVDRMCWSWQCPHPVPQELLPLQQHELQQWVHLFIWLF